MNEFPLAPFFIALSLDGIPVTMDDYERVARVLSTGGEWNRNRLRGALLALLIHTPEQAEIFKRRFDDFFQSDSSDGEKLTAQQVEKILGELKNFNVPRPKTPNEEKLPPPLRAGAFFGLKPSTAPNAPPIKKTRLPSKSDLQTALKIFWNLARRKFSVWHIVAVLLAAALVLGIYWFVPSPGSTPIISKDNFDAPITANQHLSNPQPESNAPHLPNAVKVERGGKPLPLPLVERHWSDSVGAVALTMLPFVLWLLLSLLSSQFLKEPPPSFDSKKERLFSLKNIGGEPLPQLAAATLDHLADSLSYFLSENAGKRLDIERSVRAAGRNAGLPVLYFERLKRVRSIYILEDANAEPLAWNPIAGELAEGLSKRGINVRYGKFYGTPEKIQMREGGAEWLEDLDTQNQNTLVLFFSDGKSLNPRRDGFLLESLARSASIAWLDLREKEFWDESAELIKNCGIPLYQANAAGLTRALQRFLTERSSESDDAQDIKRWRGIPANTGSNLAAYVESLLGDALAWAQACAMIQPLSNGMADKLRRRFEPNLPPERIERLHRLPGTTRNVSGLRFSLPVLAILRRGFARRWNADEQRKILEFIIGQIEILEPPEKDSLRHLSWEWSLERVRLELDPDTALPRLARLERTPLKDNIKAEFANLILPDAPGASKADQVPLRVRPKTQVALDQFGELSGQPVKRNDFSESLEAARHEVIAAYREMRRAAIELYASVRLLPDAIFGTAEEKSGATGTVVAEPAELRFSRLRVGESDSQTLTLRRDDAAPISGRVLTDAAWLRIHKSFCDSEPRHVTRITARADGLKPGEHTAVVRFVPADATGEPLEIEVRARVVRSWLAGLINWWRENRPSHVMKVALVGLFAGLVALVLAQLFAPPKWFNALYNRAPELLGQLGYDLTDARILRLTANVKDANGDKVSAVWKEDWENVDAKNLNASDESPVEDSATVPLQHHLTKVELDDLPRTVLIKLTLKDDGGGQSIYETVLTLDKNFNQNFPPVEPPPVQPTQENDDQNKTVNQEGNSPSTLPKEDTPLNPVVRRVLIPPIDEMTRPPMEVIRMGNDDLKTKYINEAENYWENGNFEGGYGEVTNGLEFYESLSEDQKKYVSEEDIEHLKKLEVNYAEIYLGKKIEDALRALNFKNYEEAIVFADNGLRFYEGFRTQTKEKFGGEARRLRQIKSEAEKRLTEMPTPTPIITPTEEPTPILATPAPAPSVTPMPTVMPTTILDRPARAIVNDNPRNLTGKEVKVSVRVTVGARGQIVNATALSVIKSESSAGGYRGQVEFLNVAKILTADIGNDSYKKDAEVRVRKNWKFEPAIRNGKPIESSIIVEVIFSRASSNQKTKSE